MITLKYTGRRSKRRTITNRKAAVFIMVPNALSTILQYIELIASILESCIKEISQRIKYTNHMVICQCLATPPLSTVKNDSSVPTNYFLLEEGRRKQAAFRSVI